jgi:Protein of unknown function (DUF2846)
MKTLFICVLTFCSMTCTGFTQQPSAPSPQSTAPQTESSPTTTQASTQADKATVYFYRYKQYVGSALSPSVYCDEAELARAENGRYFAVRLNPGKHTFRSNDKQSGAEVDLKPGQEYFLRVELVSGFMKGHGRLVAVVPEQAKFELQSKQLKPLSADKVTDKERVSVEPATFAGVEKASK